ncbi:MAG TPA: xanthine dehydrogenase family protein subunit M [Micromonosporaceae bacterium]
MRPVSYMRATDVDEAVGALTAGPDRAFLAGGTTEIDLLRLGVTAPDVLVDINDLPLAAIEDRPDGVRIGALARMSDVARAPSVIARFPGMSQALLLGASEQLRNMATIGGNLCQRTRCAYFRDGLSGCNKREPGSGCAAMDGANRGHAILGTSDHCIATHPSDFAVALVALDAVVQTIGPNGTRTIPIESFYLEPGDTPHLEHPLEYGELIAAVDVPGTPIAAQSSYVKYRDRQSYEFALVSLFTAVSAADGRIEDVRLALGGVGTVPWRARRAEAALRGAPATPDVFAAAADDEMTAAVTREHNAFKVEFAKRVIRRGLAQATGGGMS